MENYKNLITSFVEEIDDIKLLEMILEIIVVNNKEQEG